MDIAFGIFKERVRPQRLSGLGFMTNGDKGRNTVY